MSRVPSTVLALVLLSSGCATTQHEALRARRLDAAAPAVKALQEARFEDALRESASVLEQDDGNATAHAVWAVAELRQTLHDLVSDGFTLVMGLAGSGFMHQGIVSTRLIDLTLTDADRRMEGIEAHLAKAAKDPDFSLDLCLACWKVDWNRNGEIDSRDLRMLQVEYDAQSQPIPEGDPRRTPTFHFDAADVSWLRAMVNFQRALINGVLAYDVGSALESILGQGHEPKSIVIHLRDRSRVQRARELILAGLEQSAREREQVLAETDDDREWLPNPRQKNHPLPFPVDEALFQTWEGVLSDLRGLMRSEQGLSVEELAQLGEHQWTHPPKGFIDVGKLLSEPGDIVLNPERLDEAEDAASRARYEVLESGKSSTSPVPVEAALKDILGAKYRPQMKPSPLIQRVSRMKKEIDRGEESFERKLRYLLWLN